jgi:cell filamentation protein
MFDPFGDFETQGYLRNSAKEKNLDIVRRLEHTSFLTGIDSALDRLMKVKRLSYPDVLETHKFLFDAVYPWAGQDRVTNAPDLAISKGSVLFARPGEIHRAVEFALHHGQDQEFMRAKPGVIMGYLAYAHPFLDGNGRTIMVVHAVISQRAGFRIDWAATEKASYLAALTEELDDPNRGCLDRYLAPFIGRAAPSDRLAKEITRAPGLDGNDGRNIVLGKNSDPAVKARYEQQELKRRGDSSF